MAGGEEKKPAHNPWEPVLIILGIFVLGAALIWQRGGLAALKSSGATLIIPPASVGTTPEQAPQQ